MSRELPGPAWLFCPADRPERYAKAADRSDVVILDLEDAVAGADKQSARDALVATPLDPERTVVRINGVDTEHHAADLEALRRTAYTRVMLPKCEGAHQVRSLELLEVVALVESPLGVLAVEEIAKADNTVGIMWGAEDLVAGLGGSSSRRADGVYRGVAQHARSMTLLAAKGHGRWALDSVYLDIKDTDGLHDETLDAVAVGFDVKVAIHPGQIEPIRRAYLPTPEEVDWARRVLAAAENERGVFDFEGAMVDGPILEHAERLLQRSSMHRT
ncbi:MAG: CoA ester lyase [Rhodococcus sp.]|uniref:HpcH/HpaI aldolase/citrate lyase family protein n=1 Tax=Rhodococcus sp. TaxID=1831 RepID=UPI0016AF85A9|nr:CoA ester lyase [Rhodococcus sp. (in: high G+C Gram-positive bacteria)]NLV80740.1 CoA ester lyase [Rhodococcus sp. (in: high G+C Gram-positive bacteria)]